MSIFYPIEESAKSGKQTIVSASSLIYAHLMKYCFIKPRLSGWLVTIFVQIGRINEVINPSYWNDVLNDPIKLNKIKRSAISIFTKDGNEKGEIYFSIINQKIPDLKLLANKKYMINFLIEEAKKDNDTEMIEYIENNKEEWLNKK